MPALAVQDLQFAHGRGAWRLGPLSFAVARGSLLCLLGPNGCGKSSLLRILARQWHATGSVRICNQPQHAYSALGWAAVVAYLPQAVTIDYDYSVEETVSFGRYAHTRALGFLGADDHAAIDAALHATATSALRTRLLSTLSGGERQRVLLASVLVQQPKVLLLDEPTTALDVQHQVALCSVLRQCVAEGMTVVMASHDLSLAAQISDACILLHNGRMFAQGTPAEVLQEGPLQAVYGAAIEVVRHPTRPYPVIVPCLPACNAIRPGATGA